ncbi:MAG: hypothetical protein GXY74_11685 [Phycisphaerae bacterium]|nr:hypothetical protein [Phycisphaerae bacterium]
MTMVRRAMPVLVVWAMLLAAALTLRADDDRRTLTVELPDGGRQEIQVTLDQLREALEDWEPPLFTRSYDVGVLLRETPVAPRWFVDEGVRSGVDPRAGSWGAGDSYDYDDCDRPREDLLRNILMRHAQDPKEPWEEFGGRASIEFDADLGRMFVYGTELMHRRTEEFIATHLKPKTVALTAHVMAVELDESFARQLAMGGSTKADTDQRRDALNKAIVKVHGMATLSGGDGQRLYSRSGAAAGYADSVEPVVAENSAMYDVLTRFQFSGFTVVASTTLYPAAEGAAGSDRVLFDYFVCQARLERSLQGEVQGVVGQQKAQGVYDKPTLHYDEHMGTVTLDLNCPTIVAGGLAPAKVLYDDAQAAGKSGPVPLYYVVTVQKTGGDAPARAAAPADKK